MTGRTQPDAPAVLAQTPGLQYLVLDAQATIHEYAGGWADLRSRAPMTAATTMMGYSSRQTPADCTGVHRHV